MAEGRHGYNVSVGYSANFFPEMAPEWLDFCVRAQGYDSQRTGPSYRYADLGCGRGFHLCLLAAANPQAQFVGIDFDSDVAEGEALAAAAGLTNVQFLQADFLDLASNWPKELGTFDYLALQGILSWVSPEVRAAVFQCVARASKPGTIASFGYNSPPGWLSSMPFQHIANRFGRRAEPEAAIAGALTMFGRLRDAKSQFFERMPTFGTTLETMAAKPTAYLAHEFLPDHWSPLWHSDVAGQLGSVDFAYVGSATVAEAFLPDSLPADLAAVIRAEPDASLRQDIQDIAIVQRFRRDIFCREPRPAESNTLRGEVPIFLMSAPQSGARVHFRTTFGGLAVDYGVVADLLAALTDGPKQVSELMALKNPARPDTRNILLMMLDAQMVVVGSVAPYSADSAERFNAVVARGAAAGQPHAHVAAAALGSGVAVAEMDLLLLDTWLSGDRDLGAEELAAGVAERLRTLGRQLQFRGATITDDQLQPHIARLAPIFFDQMLPQWRRLGVVK